MQFAESSKGKMLLQGELLLVKRIALHPAMQDASTAQHACHDERATANVMLY
jgi:hypothetical protein